MSVLESASAPVHRGYTKGRARRAMIVRTASVQFAEKGFFSATMLDIAAACKISRAGVLHYFPDKESLLEAVLEARDAEDRGRFAPYIELAGALGVLRGMVDLAEHNRLVPGLIELFVRLSAEASISDHPAHDYFVRRYARIRTGTERALVGVARRGLLRHGIDTAGASLRLTALMDGLQAQWLLDGQIDMARHVGIGVRELLTEEGVHIFDNLTVPQRATTDATAVNQSA